MSSRSNYYSCLESSVPMLTLPSGHTRLLLHSCCAPCAGDILQVMKESQIEVVVFFFNPNIHPQQEYLIRKEESKRHADALGIPFIDADYEPKKWYALAKGMENEPERGIRCTMCFEMRFHATARYAYEHGFTLITSSLGISRWKDMQQINACGARAVRPYQGMDYWDYNWRKNGGSTRMITLAKKENFYQQQYCGCAYSLRDTNRFRKQKGYDPVRIGTCFYTN